LIAPDHRAPSPITPSRPEYRHDHTVTASDRADRDGAVTRAVKE
jgi:hypothetical protein